MNGIPIILCFISVIWNICLNRLLRNLFCSIVLVGTRKVEFFYNLLGLRLVLLLVYLWFLWVLVLGVGIPQVGILMIFDSAPQSIKKSISRSGG